MDNNLYKVKFHEHDLSSLNFLITGGAGFIGSNLVQYLLKYNAKKVRVLDNLSNGYFENIQEFLEFENFEFVEGDIRDLETCHNACKDINYISHQAALGSVPRSIQNPSLTNDVNISGFLNIMIAAKESPSLIRFVYAASSSTYGDSNILPKVEGVEGRPLSPYAVTKAVNELYAEVFSKVYNFHSIGLRYFNVFGPSQNANNPYAAVIPIFCRNFIEKNKIQINGDGLTSRDFTFVENVVQANIKALFYNNLTSHQILNTACGDQITLLDIVNELELISGHKVDVVFNPERVGDVKYSRADISKIIKLLDYSPTIRFKDGLRMTFEYYKHCI
uniref:NAD-dependent epimerase/dehydratase family protein n=1 Tax=Algoriphagus sp. TaxID=1872435 RepID=UPI0040482A2A